MKGTIAAAGLLFAALLAPAGAEAADARALSETERTAVREILVHGCFAVPRLAVLPARPRGDGRECRLPAPPDGLADADMLRLYGAVVRVLASAPLRAARLEVGTLEIDVALHALAPVRLAPDDDGVRALVREIAEGEGLALRGLATAGYFPN